MGGKDRVGSFHKAGRISRRQSLQTGVLTWLGLNVDVLARAAKEKEL